MVTRYEYYSNNYPLMQNLLRNGFISVVYNNRFDITKRFHDLKSDNVSKEWVYKEIDAMTGINYETVKKAVLFMNGEFCMNEELVST